MNKQMKQFFQEFSSKNEFSYFSFLKIYRDPEVLLRGEESLSLYKFLFLHPSLPKFVDCLLKEAAIDNEYPLESLLKLKEILKVSYTYKMEPAAFLRSHKAYMKAIEENSEYFSKKARLFDEWEADKVLFGIGVESEIRAYLSKTVPFYEKDTCMENPSFVLKYLYEYHIERESDDEFVFCKEDESVVCSNSFLKGLSKVGESHLDSRYLAVILHLLDIGLAIKEGMMSMEYYTSVIGKEKIETFSRKKAILLYTKFEAHLQRVKRKKLQFKIIK